MPGYLLHLAACKPDLLENESFRKGVEAPDLLKKWVAKFGLDEARKKYASWKEIDMPSFSFFEERALAKDDDQAMGLHYGYSSNPDLVAFLDMLPKGDEKNPFWRGYFWHLVTDKIMYTWLNIGKTYKRKIQRLMKEGYSEDVEKNEKKRLHDDWDRINKLVLEEFNVSLPPEIEELNIVKFINDGQPLTYIKWEEVKQIIKVLRTMQSLTRDLNNVENLINMIDWDSIPKSLKSSFE